MGKPLKVMIIADAETIARLAIGRRMIALERLHGDAIRDQAVCQAQAAGASTARCTRRSPTWSAFMPRERCRGC
jgi:hypothetical protein